MLARSCYVPYVAMTLILHHLHPCNGTAQKGITAAEKKIFVFYTFEQIGFTQTA